MCILAIGWSYFGRNITTSRGRTFRWGCFDHSWNWAKSPWKWSSGEFSHKQSYCATVRSIWLPNILFAPKKKKKCQECSWTKNYWIPNLFTSYFTSIQNIRLVDVLIVFLMFFQENYYWLDRILRSYQSRVYSGDLAASFEVGAEVCFVYHPCTIYFCLLFGFLSLKHMKKSMRIPVVDKAFVFQPLHWTIILQLHNYQTILRDGHKLGLPFCRLKMKPAPKLKTLWHH